MGEAETVWRLAPGLEVRSSATDDVEVNAAHGPTVSMGSRGFALLHAFAVPRSLAEAIEVLARDAAGTVDFVELTSLVVALQRAGVLVDHASTGEPIGVTPGFAHPAEHLAMLDDVVRTSAFLDAIARVVQPGDVVADVGTGTGVLAVAAARAGASRVYAIEATAMASAAERVVAATGLGDRITVLHGRSTALEIPELVDVVVSETIGNDPFGEQVLETMADAVSRFLRPGGAVVPRSVRLSAHPAQLPEEEARRRSTGDATIEAVNDRYGLDLTPLRRVLGGVAYETSASRRAVATWERLGPTTAVGVVEMASPPRFVDAPGALPIDRAGRLDAVVCSFRLTVDAYDTIDTDPATSDGPSSWRLPVWIHPDAPLVRADMVVPVTYRYRVPGSADGMTIGSPR